MHYFFLKIDVDETMLSDWVKEYIEKFEVKYTTRNCLVSSYVFSG